MHAIRIALLVLGCCCVVAIGISCANRPYYGLAYLNPVVTDQWKRDSDYGPTFYDKMAELQTLKGEAKKRDRQGQEELAMQMNYLLGESKNPLLRAEAVRVLSELSVPTAEVGLISASSDEDADVRRAACVAWGKRGGPRALETLRDVVARDESRDVKLVAISGLGNFSDQAAVDALARALDDRDPAVQLRAVASLEKSTGQDLGSSVTAWRAQVRGEPIPPLNRPSIAQQILNWF
jgi:hypothetical protein